LAAVLVDTNILLRMARADNPDHALVKNALAQSLSAGTTHYYTQQNIAEFRRTATRSVDKNGLGLSVTDVDTLVQTIEAGMLLLVEDTEAVYREWRRLVVAHSVSGVQVHDARLVAAMRVHRVQHILTFNVKDFQRYLGITPVHPSEAASA
jgi:predicted nucleic acid-binding protein